jgi:PIN domain nuclease of toxin-antitoxin system
VPSYLLDTHAFLWWLSDEARLGPRAREAIQEPANDVFVSAATAWEISIKRRSGKLEAPGDIESWVTDSGFSDLVIEVPHAVSAGALPKHHNDPFDRMLIAQAQVEGLTLIAKDDEIAKYNVELLDACI